MLHGSSWVFSRCHQMITQAWPKGPRQSSMVKTKKAFFSQSMQAIFSENGDAGCFKWATTVLRQAWRLQRTLFTPWDTVTTSLIAPTSHPFRGVSTGSPKPPKTWTKYKWLQTRLPLAPISPSISLGDIHFLPTRSKFALFQGFLNFSSNAPKFRSVGGGMCILFEICEKRPFQKCMSKGGIGDLIFQYRGRTIRRFRVFGPQAAPLTRAGHQLIGLICVPLGALTY